MKYENIKSAIFKNRPNRFVAEIEIDGKPQIAHVKNTGRCRELLTENAEIYVQEIDSSSRKTRFDVVAVKKQNKLINIDSQAPNKVLGEWMKSGGFFKNITCIKPECKYKNSRFDFYIEADGEKIFVEVKGVTLEEDGVVMFPDAPTVRGIKHLNELIDAVASGYGAFVFFVAQMKDAQLFMPNRQTHPEFADALSEAAKKGVKVFCVTCNVKKDSLEIDGRFVPIEGI